MIPDAGQGILMPVEKIPLTTFPVARAHSVNAAQEFLRGRMGARWLSFGDGGRTLDLVVNRYDSPSVRLTFLRYGSPFTMNVTSDGMFIQGFVLSGAGEA